MVATTLAASEVGAIEGRYLGSVHRTDLGSDRVVDEFQRHLYDVSGHRTLPRNLDLRLRASLQYQSRLDVSGQDLMRGRLFGDLRSPSWRLGAQYVPWQNIAAGPNPAREQDVQLHFGFAKPRLPQLAIDFGRLDRETVQGRSSSDNRRVQLSWDARGVGTQAGYRRVDTHTPGFGAFRSVTDEWRGGMQTARTWGAVSVRGGYEGLYSKTTQRERRRDLNSHRLTAGASWSPTRRFTLGSNLYERWGWSSDNADPGRRDLGERAADASADWRPWDGVQFEALHQYRQRRTPTGEAITQYVQLETAFRRPVRRGLVFQTGYLGSVNLRSETGELPNNAVYGLVDGRLRAGLDGRAELRAARSAGGISTGTHWQRVLQLRSRPTRITRLDVTWRKDTLPEFEGVAQQDRQWEVVGGWEPLPGANLVGSWRRLDGSGRIGRAERYTAFSSSWRTTRRTSVGFNWSRRLSWTTFGLSRELVTGADLSFWLPRQLEMRATWRDTDGTARPYTRSFGLSLQKNF